MFTQKTVGHYRGTPTATAIRATGPTTAAAMTPEEGAEELGEKDDFAEYYFVPSTHACDRINYRLLVVKYTGVIVTYRRYRGGWWRRTVRRRAVTV